MAGKQNFYYASRSQIEIGAELSVSQRTRSGCESAAVTVIEAHGGTERTYLRSSRSTYIASKNVVSPQYIETLGLQVVARGISHTKVLADEHPHPFHGSFLMSDLVDADTE